MGFFDDLVKNVKNALQTVVETQETNKVPKAGLREALKIADQAISDAQTTLKQTAQALKTNIPNENRDAAREAEDSLDQKFAPPKPAKPTKEQVFNKEVENMTKKTANMQAQSGTSQEMETNSAKDTKPLPANPFPPAYKDSKKSQKWENKIIDEQSNNKGPQVPSK